MKKGILALEALVKLIPTILITVALIVILGTFINSFLSSNKTVEEQDFARIRAEVDELLKLKILGTITVPVSNPNGVIITTYSQNDALPICNQKPCICINYRKDGKELNRCQIYEQLADCSKVCISRTSHLTLSSSQKTVTVTRSANDILIT